MCSPQMSHNEADLILARAAGGDGQAGTGQRLYTAETFCNALVSVAMKYQRGHRPLAALESWCREVLVPLGEQVLGTADSDVRIAVSVLSDPEVAAVLKNNRNPLR